MPHPKAFDSQLGVRLKAGSSAVRTWSRRARRSRRSGNAPAGIGYPLATRAAYSAGARRNRVPAVLATAALVLAAAVAAPATAGEPEYHGSTCGFISTSDPTGLVEQDPNIQTGEMDCGPWAAADFMADDGSGPSGPDANSITITGTIQVNQANYGGQAAARASVSGSGVGVAAAADVITYSALRTDNVYLCTRVDMTDGNGNTYSYTYDEDDNPANGNQCALTVSGGDEPPPPPYYSFSADERGHHVAVGDEFESGSIDYTDLADDEITHAGSESDHKHNSSARCTYNRSGKDVTLKGHMTLGKHAEHKSVALRCELYDTTTTPHTLVASFDTSTTGGQVPGQAAGKTTSKKKHRICITARGTWTDDHYVDLPRSCRID